MPSGADAAAPAGPTAGFGDRLAEHVARRRSQLVLGLDPDPARLWPEALPAGTATAGEAGPGSGPAGDTAPDLVSGAEGAAELAARAVLAHCRLVLDAVADQCVAVKPQVACFERLGAPGWATLAAVVRAAHAHGLLVIADAKRGDIDVTAAAYGQAFFGGVQTPFGPVDGLGADALTANPLLGADSISPLLDAARPLAGGLFVLVRTSNPGAADVQDQALAGGGSVSDGLAAMVARLGAPSIGPSGIADVGAVVGATVPEHLARLRGLMPSAPLLLPGVGAQGGSVGDLAPAFAPGAAGGLIAVSRGLVYAFEKSGTSPAGAARDEAARLRHLAWSLFERS